MLCKKGVIVHIVLTECIKRTKQGVSLQSSDIFATLPSRASGAQQPQLTSQRHFIWEKPTKVEFPPPTFFQKRQASHTGMPEIIAPKRFPPKKLTHQGSALAKKD